MPTKSQITRENRYKTRSSVKVNNPKITSKSTKTTISIKTPSSNQEMASQSVDPSIPTINPSDIPEGSMESKMDFLIAKVIAINNDTSNIIQNQVQQMQTLTSNVTSITSDVINIKRENDILRAANVKLAEKVTSLECYSRLNNLILRNVPEEHDAGTVLDTVKKLLIDTMKIPNVSTMLFDDVHRK